MFAKDRNRGRPYITIELDDTWYHFVKQCLVTKVQSYVAGFTGKMVQLSRALRSDWL